MEIIVSGTNLGALYKATDGVLKKYGEDARHSVPESIKGQSAMSVLKKLFKQDHFSICDVDKLCETYSVELSNEHYNWMHSLHCVKFTDMHEDTREYLFAVMIQYFKPVISMSYATNT